MQIHIIPEISRANSAAQTLIPIMFPEVMRQIGGQQLSTLAKKTLFGLATEQFRVSVGLLMILIIVLFELVKRHILLVAQTAIQENAGPSLKPHVINVGISDPTIRQLLGIRDRQGIFVLCWISAQLLLENFVEGGHLMASGLIVWVVSSSSFPSYFGSVIGIVWDFGGGRALIVGFVLVF
jgi:hypothetical protein